MIARCPSCRASLDARPIDHDGVAICACGERSWIRPATRARIEEEQARQLRLALEPSRATA
jgi:hypothetical protein